MQSIVDEEVLFLHAGLLQVHGLVVDSPLDAEDVEEPVVDDFHQWGFVLVAEENRGD